MPSFLSSNRGLPCSNTMEADLYTVSRVLGKDEGIPVAGLQLLRGLILSNMTCDLPILIVVTQSAWYTLTQPSKRSQSRFLVATIPGKERVVYTRKYLPINSVVNIQIVLRINRRTQESRHNHGDGRVWFYRGRIPLVSWPASDSIMQIFVHSSMESGSIWIGRPCELANGRSVMSYKMSVSSIDYSMIKIYTCTVGLLVPEFQGIV